MRVTIIGSGSSSGTPAIDWGWGRCDPENPRNRRQRASILVQERDTTVLVDASPDLREQLLGARIRHLDAVLFTHSHADHLHGIDDLRAVNRAMGAPLDVYADDETLALIDERFGYVFEALDPEAKVYYKPMLVPHGIGDGDAFSIGAIDIAVFEQDHGLSTSLGFRFGSVAYSTYVVVLSDDAPCRARRYRGLDHRNPGRDRTSDPRPRRQGSRLDRAGPTGACRVDAPQPPSGLCRVGGPAARRGRAGLRRHGHRDRRERGASVIRWRRDFTVCALGACGLGSKAGVDPIS